MDVQQRIRNLRIALRLPNEESAQMEYHVAHEPSDWIPDPTSWLPLRPAVAAGLSELTELHVHDGSETYTRVNERVS